MAEPCSTKENENISSEVSTLSTSADIVKTDCTSPSPTETVCLDPEPVAGPSHIDKLQPVADRLNEIVQIEQNEDLINLDDELLDNSLNETQERILLDNKTPDRLINNKYGDSDNLFEKQENDFFLRNGLFSKVDKTGDSSVREDCHECNVRDVRSGLECGLLGEPDEDNWEDCEEELDTVDDEGDSEEMAEEEICEEERDDNDILEDVVEISAKEIKDPLHETATTAMPSTRSWRKRKLDAQNGFQGFPSKKLFPENKTAVDICNRDITDGCRAGVATCTSTSEPMDEVISSTVTEKKHHQRSVIPTKDNPPPEMTGWLSQFQRWSNAERLLAIDELIDRCEPTQVRHMMQVIEPQFQRDFISLLPRELALNVLSFLEPRDLLRAAQTCRSWRFLAEDNLLWREKCRQAGIDDYKELMPKKGRRSRTPPIHSSPWKAAFMRQHAIEMNWRYKPIRQPKVLKGHDDHVITCLQFCGNRIVSGSDDNTLKVWSATSGKCLRTLVGHTGGVWSSQMSGSIIISGSTDRTLKVWDAESGACIHTLYGHTSTVRCMHLHKNKVVSGSRDATLRVWNVDSGECLHVLVGHLAAVRCVQYDGRLVVSGAYDYMVKVWNPEREECLHTLQGHTNRVYSLQFDGVHVVSGSLDTSIRVWEVETGACKHTLMGHQSLTSGMELRNNILVSGNADSTVKVWDILTGHCLQTLSGPNKHQSAVTCLQFNNRFVITSSDDGTVKLWDVKTGEFVRNLVELDSGGSGGVVWRIRANDTKLVCAVGSRNGTEETKLLVLDFDVESNNISRSRMTAITIR